MKTLNELVKIGFCPSEIRDAIGAEYVGSADYNNKIKSIISDCDDVDTLKEAAIEFDGIEAFFSLEEKLVSLIGDDYYDFAEENDLA